MFTILKRQRLNVAKCTFKVSSGKFLGHLVTRREIEANPEQITTINNLVSSKTMKEVPKLIGMAVALNRFISKSYNKRLTFFTLLRKNTKFSWNKECEFAL